MLRARLTEPRRVVSLHDPAIEAIEFQLIKAYSTSRNIDDLGDLSALPEQATVFTITQMLPKYQHLEGRADLLFAAHCSGCENGPVDKSDFETKDGRTSLKVESLEKIPRTTVLELGGVVWELSSVDGDVSPFSSPGIELVNRIREVQSHRALRAHMITRAAETLSKQSALTSSQKPTEETASLNSTPESSEEPNASSSPAPTIST